MEADSRQPSPPGPSSTPRRRVRTIITLALLGALVAYAATGFYFVQPDERGVVRWFGRVPDSQLAYGVAPGLHYTLPWPCCRVDCPQITVVRSVFVGMDPQQREAIARGETWAMQASPASDTFTGDVNILKVTMAVHYKVNNPVAYLLATEDPDELVGVAVQGVLIDELAALPVDGALTNAKAKIEFNTQQRAQRLLEETYGSGVQLVGTNLESIEPPRAIVSAFKDVVSAKKDGESAIDRAVAEANRILPRARGDAAQILEEARGYYETRVSRARGEADSFLNLLAEYRRAPGVTENRLRLQTFEKVLAKVRKVIVDNKPGETPAKIRIIDESPE